MEKNVLTFLTNNISSLLIIKF